MEEKKNMNEPIPVSLAIRAVERAIRECDAATPGPWRVGILDVWERGVRVVNARNDDFAVLARAGFRASLEYLRLVLESSCCLSPAMAAAIAPLIVHYDATAPGWRAQ